MNPDLIKFELFRGLVNAAAAAAPQLFRVILGIDPLTLPERFERARMAIKDPIDTSAEDEARWQRLEDAFRQAE